MTTISCSNGVYDCNYRDIPSSETSCAYYDGEYKDMEGRLWIMITSCIIMCSMAFGMGSNDAANSWGTSVGSGAISLRHAITIGAIMEFLGAITLGYGVSDTIQKGVSDIKDENCWACGYCNSEMSVYQTGMFGSLVSTSIFLLLSSFTSMPVSATHVVVGGVVGMTWANVGSSCLNWAFDGLGGIIASWAISPLLSGVIGALTYIITQKIIFESNFPRDRALIALPIFITLVTFIISFLICLKSPVTKDQELWIHFTISLSISLFALLLSLILILPWAKKNLPSLTNITNSTIENGNPVLQNKINENGSKSGDVCNAALESFAHGANDTANCTGPFRAVLQIYQHGLDSCHDTKSGQWVMHHNIAAPNEIFVTIVVYVVVW